VGGVRVVDGVRLAASVQAVKAGYRYAFISVCCGDPEDSSFCPESRPSPDLDEKLWEQSKCLD
jgi:hypothetical protein